MFKSALILLTFTLLGCGKPSSTPSGIQGRVNTEVGDSRYFNSYILKAISFIDANYRLLGYNITGVLTHNLPYSNLGTLTATRQGKTMCVAAQLEIMLTAMQIYSSETGDASPFAYLPIRSWKNLNPSDIRAHIWVDSKLKSYGGSDALVHFGMGEKVPFNRLQAGGFINLNRNNRTGHAVIFLAFIDIQGNEYSTYNSQVVGFKYYSAQGKNTPGLGGMDIRDAVFSKFGCPDNLPYKRDCGVEYSTRQDLLNTGMMLAPAQWRHTQLSMMAWQNNIDGSVVSQSQTVFDAEKFNGVTTDD
jgi:hypothetical protein